MHEYKLLLPYSPPFQPLPLVHIPKWNLLFFFLVPGLVLRTYNLESLHQPFFVLGFFKIGSCKLFAWGWLWTSIPLIFASWVARITSAHPYYSVLKMKFCIWERTYGICLSQDGLFCLTWWSLVPSIQTLYLDDLVGFPSSQQCWRQQKRAQSSPLSKWFE
jgi:hypothetical protein